MDKSVKVFYMLTAIITLGMICVVADTTNTEEFNKESYYVAKHCKGETEVTLVDRSRVDCVQTWDNEQYVIEYDWANKYKEAFGQAVSYSTSTGKKAGVVLIMRKTSDVKYLRRLERMNNKLKYPIKIKTVEIE